MELLEAWDWAADEIGAALTFTRRRTEADLGLAHTVLGKLPAVWAALAAGHIDIHKARVFADHLGDLADAQISRICARLLPLAPGWTTGQLAARLLREVLAIDREFARRRYDAGDGIARCGAISTTTAPPCCPPAACRPPKRSPPPNAWNGWPPRCGPPAIPPPRTSYGPICSSAFSTGATRTSRRIR